MTIPTMLCSPEGDAYFARCAVLSEAFTQRRTSNYLAAERAVERDYAKLSPAKFIAKYGAPQ